MALPRNMSMKRRDLISKLEEMDRILVRHGGKHDGIIIQLPNRLNLFYCNVKSKNILQNI